jgi:glycosyltransferase involved in cell wall biosynthesis
MSLQSSPLVSVIIPCYNHARFLGEAIESVLNQTYRRFEIVVIDDGSTDETSRVAARYEGVRLISQSNHGLAAARNAGLRASTGSYKVFLDADDRLLPKALETGVYALKAHTDCAFVFGRCLLIEADGSPVASGPQPRIEGHHYQGLLRDNYIWNPAQVIYRGDVFKSVGAFDTSISAAADYDLYLRISRSFPVYGHYNVVVEYRKHGQNMSCDSWLMLKTTLAVLRSQWDHIKGDKAYEGAYREGIKHWQSFYGERLVNEIRAHIRAHEWKKASLDILALARYHPRGVVEHAGRKSYRTISKLINPSGFSAQ